MLLSLAMLLVVLLAISIQSSDSPYSAMVNPTFIVEEGMLKPKWESHLHESDAILNEYLVQSREAFPSQHFYGSVTLGGANIVIPKGTVWRDSVITRLD